MLSKRLVKLIKYKGQFDERNEAYMYFLGKDYVCTYSDVEGAIMVTDRDTDKPVYLKKVGTRNALNPASQELKDLVDEKIDREEEL